MVAIDLHVVKVSDLLLATFNGLMVCYSAMTLSWAISMLLRGNLLMSAIFMSANEVGGARLY
jgi:hypothetical protein